MLLEFRLLFPQVSAESSGNTGCKCARESALLRGNS
jgi:hypothetical protein